MIFLFHISLCMTSHYTGKPRGNHVQTSGSGGAESVTALVLIDLSLSTDFIIRRRSGSQDSLHDHSAESWILLLESAELIFTLVEAC